MGEFVFQLGARGSPRAILMTSHPSPPLSVTGDPSPAPFARCSAKPLLVPGGLAAIIATGYLHPLEAQTLALCAAFWVALLDFQARGGHRADALRFVLGLALAALICHVGWQLVLAPDGRLSAARLLESPAGASALFLPLGALLTAPRPAQLRLRYLAPALGALPVALAAARLGCWAAGCCEGARVDGLPALQLLEATACVALALLTRVVPRALVPGAVLAGLGSIRLGSHPLRAAACELDSAAVPILAGAWIALGLYSAGRAWRREP